MHSMASKKMSYFLPLLFLSIKIFSSITQAATNASVPANETFRFVNEGKYLELISSTGTYLPLDIIVHSADPFQLCFYNTTPGAFTLAIRMGSLFSHLVWEANRGNPVGENSTITFGPDGNLVLAQANGLVVWQTDTANKGVVGLKLLPNGNLVLLGSSNPTTTFIWQSFDYPTDTLLVGQSLTILGPTKLVSPARDPYLENMDGPYSMVVETNGLNMYYKSKNYPKPVIYYVLGNTGSGESTLLSVQFDYQIQPEPETTNARLQLKFTYVNPPTIMNYFFSSPNYNSSLTMLKLETDGNLKAYTYYDNDDFGEWEVTFTLFSREDGGECKLPNKCGDFGLCDSDSQCVACPLPSGLMGWNKDCQPPKLLSGKNKFVYYKIEGVDHFLSGFNNGCVVMQDKCLMKCSNDFKCLGYFYHQENSRCWIAYDLKTLIKVTNSSHVGYIKAPLLKNNLNFVIGDQHV